MPNSVTCSCENVGPGIYNVTVTFTYQPAGGLKVNRLPPPEATYFLNGVESSRGHYMQETGANTNIFNKTFYFLSGQPTKGKAYFKEITDEQSLESPNCPCTNCRAVETEVEVMASGDKKKSKKKKK